MYKQNDMRERQRGCERVKLRVIQMQKDVHLSFIDYVKLLHKIRLKDIF